MSKAKMHPLEQEAAELASAENKTAAIQLMQTANTAIRERQKWMAARQEQINEIEELKKKLFKAFDDGDKIAIQQIAAEFNSKFKG